jgi:hypothetical protein
MALRSRHLVILLAMAFPTCGLSGCGTINEKLAEGVGDYVPQWLGGLPPDAPPRPGTAKYDEYMKERERQRLAPAAKTDVTNTPTSPAGLSPVH